MTDPRIVPGLLIVLRYRDKFVYLAPEYEPYGTITQRDDDLGRTVEWDFSGCRVVGVEARLDDRQPALTVAEAEQRLLNA